MNVAGAVGVAAAVTVLPPTVQVADAAVRQGVMSAADAETVEPKQVFVGDGNVEDLAEAAARSAVDGARCDPSRLALVAVACLVETASTWKLAPAVARRIGADEAIAVGVRQMSNGGGIAAQLAIAQLLALERPSDALVVAADSLTGDGWGRWNFEGLGMAVSDGASAVVLTTGPAPLRVISVVTRGCAAQEASFPALHPVSSGNGNSSALGAFDPRLVFRLRRQVRTCLEEAWAQADGRQPEIVVLPRVGSRMVKILIQGNLPRPSAATVELTGRTGHLGAGDLLANLAHLFEEQLPRFGGRAAVISIGGGFAVTCMVVERSYG